MTAWLNLTKKELRLGMSAFLLPIIVFIILVSIASYFGNRVDMMWEAIAFVAFGATSIQVFYLVYYLFHSLRSERKNLHLWLHNPMPGYSLLLSKITAGLVSMLITFILTATTMAVSLSQSSRLTDQLPLYSVINIGVFGGFHLFLIAINLAVWFVFFWMIFLLSTRYIGTFLSFLSTFIIFILTTSLDNWFSSTAVYKKLTMWGQFQTPELLKGLNIVGNPEHADSQVITETAQIHLYLGIYIFEIILVAILFIAASWILDRKVEVS